MWKQFSAECELICYAALTFFGPLLPDQLKPPQSALLIAVTDVIPHNLKGKHASNVDGWHVDSGTECVVCSILVVLVVDLCTPSVF